LYATLASEQPTAVRRLDVSSTFTKRLFRSTNHFAQELISSLPFSPPPHTLSIPLSISISITLSLSSSYSLYLSFSHSHTHTITLSPFFDASLFPSLSLLKRARVSMSIMFLLSASQFVLSFRSTKLSFALYSSGQQQQQMSVHAESRKNNNNNNNNKLDVVRKTFHAEINFIW